MRIDNEYFFIDLGDFSRSDEFSKILQELRSAIQTVTWHSKDRFIINPTKRGNGVFPIKLNFIKKLESYGWESERRMSFARGMRPGPVDIVKETKYGIFAVEWETGNISSSHRALNKIAVGIIQDFIIGGIVILPIRNLARYLTDRIGNYEELSPYFPLYENISIEYGVIGVISLDYDGTSNDAPLIQKGKDGNAPK